MVCQEASELQREKQPKICTLLGLLAVSQGMVQGSQNGRGVAGIPYLTEAQGWEGPSQI